MRFNPDDPTTAADLVNSLDEEELADLIYEYGEEHASRRIARAIVHARPIRTASHLAQIIESAVGRHGKIHPATRTFQALRIEVNREIEVLQKSCRRSRRSLDHMAKWRSSPFTRSKTGSSRIIFAPPSP